MTAERRQAAPDNRILQSLPAVERDRLGAAAEVVELAAGEVVCRVGARLRHVYFPRRGAVSLFVRAGDGAAVGVGLVRSDGMFGLGAAAGNETSGILAVAQGPGHGDRIEAASFRRLLPACPALRSSLFVHALAVSAQRAQDIACITLHSSSQRVARWMLDVSGSGHGSGLSATQAAMAEAVGLQRPAVSRVAGALQRSGVISFRRGEVRILDRAALRVVACRCSIRFASDR